MLSTPRRLYEDMVKEIKNKAFADRSIMQNFLMQPFDLRFNNSSIYKEAIAAGRDELFYQLYAYQPAKKKMAHFRHLARVYNLDNLLDDLVKAKADDEDIWFLRRAYLCEEDPGLKVDCQKRSIAYIRGILDNWNCSFWGKEDHATLRANLKALERFSS